MRWVMNATLISNPRNTEELSQLTYTLYETNSLFLTIPYYVLHVLYHVMS